MRRDAKGALHLPDLPTQCLHGPLKAKSPAIKTGLNA
ncbi:hypothetical protein LMG28140_05006 [Paraburkholderia metrosideri]|jgi:hypothetical protein|uniref:Transposase n=1 Tax=Paraburkholderia metrosideri TaxID=580937 RepID=A0ABN7I5S1_9BURK|nr:hypothetical protein LMG28140_05006 [Paraburkholderia metrosideri]